MDQIKVFVSYSHDSPEHMNRVLELSNRLRIDGIDSNLDQYEMSPQRGWIRWMNDQIEEASFVLVVCTESYGRRFSGREARGTGLGSNWEGAVISQELYDAAINNTKFVPILFTSSDSRYIPPVLRAMSWFLVDTESGYEKVYRLITNQPYASKPEIGKIREMPTLLRRQVFTDREVWDQDKSEVKDPTPPIEILMPVETASSPKVSASGSRRIRHPLEISGLVNRYFLGISAANAAVKPALSTQRLRCQKQNPKWILWSVSSLITLKPERGRQSTAKRAKRAEFIERSETVDDRRSGGYRACAKHGRRKYSLTSPTPSTWRSQNRC